MADREKTVGDAANMTVVVDLEVFKMAVYFFFGSEEYYCEQLKKRTEQDSHGETPGRPCAGHFNKYVDWQANRYWHVVWVKDMNNAGTIAHECFHAARSVLDTIGVKYHEGDANEVFAHVIGTLVRNVQYEISWRQRNQHSKESEC